MLHQSIKPSELLKFFVNQRLIRNSTKATKAQDREKKCCDTGKTNTQKFKTIHRFRTSSALLEGREMYQRLQDLFCTTEQLQQQPKPNKCNLNPQVSVKTLTLDKDWNREERVYFYKSGREKAFSILSQRKVLQAQWELGHRPFKTSLDGRHHSSRLRDIRVL